MQTIRDTMQVTIRDTMQDVFWFYNTDEWFYRYELYEQGVDMSREFLVYYCGSAEYKEFFSNLVDYK